eukprot:m.107088 g.107088  ORF g.107088 m.107088 type:complete len:1005 (-) comp12731_c0_seq1:306-3320(-)
MSVISSPQGKKTRQHQALIAFTAGVSHNRFERQCLLGRHRAHGLERGPVAIGRAAGRRRRAVPLKLERRQHHRHARQRHRNPGGPRRHQVRLHQREKHPRRQRDHYRVVTQRPPKVGPDSGKGLPRQVDRHDQIVQVGPGQHHVGGLDRHVRSGSNRHPDIGLRQSRRVVDPVAHHRHREALGLQLLYLGALVTGEHFGKHVADPHLLRHGRRRRRVVAGQHHHLALAREQLADHRGRLLAHLARDRDHRFDRHGAVLGPLGHVGHRQQHRGLGSLAVGLQRGPDLRSDLAANPTHQRLVSDPDRAGSDGALQPESWQGLVLRRRLATLLSESLRGVGVDHFANGVLRLGLGLREEVQLLRLLELVPVDRPKVGDDGHWVRQSPGLVKDHAVDPAEHLDRGAALDEHPEPGAEPRAHHDRRGRREPERARAGNHQRRDEKGKGQQKGRGLRGEPRLGEHRVPHNQPDHKGRDRDRHHRRHKPRRDPVGKVFDRGLGALGFVHQLDNLVEHRVVADGGGPDGEPAHPVDRAPNDRGPGALGHGPRLARHHALVGVRLPGDHLAVTRDPRPGVHPEQVAHVQQLGRDLAWLAVVRRLRWPGVGRAGGRPFLRSGVWGGWKEKGSGGLEIEEGPKGGRGLALGDRLEVLPEEDKRDEHGRGLKVLDRLKAFVDHAVHDADDRVHVGRGGAARDQHVHVGPAVRERAVRPGVEPPTQPKLHGGHQQKEHKVLDGQPLGDLPPEGLLGVGVRHWDDHRDQHRRDGQREPEDQRLKPRPPLGLHYARVAGVGHARELPGPASVGDRLQDIPRADRGPVVPDPDRGGVAGRGHRALGRDDPGELVEDRSNAVRVLRLGHGAAVDHKGDGGLVGLEHLDRLGVEPRVLDRVHQLVGRGRGGVDVDNRGGGHEHHPGREDPGARGEGPLDPTDARGAGHPAHPEPQRLGRLRRRLQREAHFGRELDHRLFKGPVSGHGWHRLDPHQPGVGVDVDRQNPWRFKQCSVKHRQLRG